MKKLFIATALLFLVSFLAPQLTGAFDAPAATGFVNDYAGILTTEQKAELENYLQNFADQTSNEIAVAIFPTLDGEPIEDVGIALGDEWQVGDKDLDNGAIFIVAVDDRLMRIEVGRGLEGVLTDLGTKWIQDEYAAPHFRDGDYFAGIQQVTQKMAEAARGEFDLEQQTQNLQTNEDVEDAVTAILVVIFFVIPWLGAILARSKSWWAGGVIGAIMGITTGFILDWSFVGTVIAIVFAGAVGLGFDYLVSKNYQKAKKAGKSAAWWAGGAALGGRSSGGSGSGFGGFSGGSFSGGGSSSSW